MDTTKAVYRCPHCCAIPPAPHAADCPERAVAPNEETLRAALLSLQQEVTVLRLRNGQLEAALNEAGRGLPARVVHPVEQLEEFGAIGRPVSAWDTFVNPPAVTIHTRDVGGVLCRWWGDGPVPAGVALIDAAAAVVGRPAVVSEGQAVHFFKQKCSSIWIEADRINWLDTEPKLADLFDVRTLYTRPAAPAPEALHRIAERMRKAGASIPAPENKGTAESAIATGLSIGLLLVQEEIESAAPAPEAPFSAKVGTEEYMRERWCGAAPEAPTAAQAPEVAAGWTRAIGQEERACRAEDALIYLVNQIRKTSPVDDHGHSTLTNMAYLKAVDLLDALIADGSLPRSALATQPKAAPVAEAPTEVARLAQRFKEMGVTNFGFTPGTNPNTTPEQAAKAINDAIDQIVDRDTPPDNRDEVVDWDITGKPKTEADRAEWVQKMLRRARENGMGLDNNPVAYEFRHPVTGHSIVDYTRHTHVGHLGDEYIALPLAYAAVQASPAKPDLSDEQIEAIFHALDGKKLIVGENSLNWNKVVRIGFARALLAAITKEQP